MDLKDWIGRTETVSDMVTPTPFAALSATLDRPAERPAAGTPLPPLWHWLYFLPLHRQSRDRPRRPRAARRLPAAGAAAAPHVGRQPVRVPPAAAHRRRCHPHLDHRGRRPRRAAAPGRWSSSRCATRSAAGGRPTSRSPSSTTSSIARRRGPATRRRRRAGAGVAAWERAVDARRRAAVPLLGADVQRPPHPLRPPLRDRGRGLSGPDRARPADRDAVARPAAPRAPDAAVARFEFRAVRPIFDTHPFFVCGEPQPDGGRCTSGAATTRAG